MFAFGGFIWSHWQDPHNCFQARDMDASFSACERQKANSEKAPGRPFLSLSLRSPEFSCLTNKLSAFSAFCHKTSGWMALAVRTMVTHASLEISCSCSDLLPGLFVFRVTPLAYELFEWLFCARVSLLRYRSWGMNQCLSGVFSSFPWCETTVANLWQPVEDWCLWVLHNYRKGLGRFSQSVLFLN